MTINKQTESLLKDLRNLRRYGHTDNTYTKMIKSLEVISEHIKVQDAEIKDKNVMIEYLVETIGDDLCMSPMTILKQAEAAIKKVEANR